MQKCCIIKMLSFGSPISSASIPRPLTPWGFFFIKRLFLGCVVSLFSSETSYRSPTLISRLANDWCPLVLNATPLRSERINTGCAKVRRREITTPMTASLVTTWFRYYYFAVTRHEEARVKLIITNQQLILVIIIH